MQAIDLRLNDNMQVVRLIPPQSQNQEGEYDYPNFPYISYDIQLSEFIGQHVHLHWHAGFHFLEILSGQMNLRTGSGVYPLEPGTVCFINVNVLHALEPVSSPAECVLRAYVFAPNLLSGAWENSLAAKYVNPIRNNPDLAHLIFDAATSERMRRNLNEVCRYHREKQIGYEFDVRHQLTLVWRELLLSLRNRLDSTPPVDERLQGRMRTMLGFIRTNYMKKIDLDEIAESAMISQRECFRCFKKTLGVTPNHYLQNYRVRRSARMLLESDEPVASIALECGFSDTSYYGKTFQKYMKCSPSEYRKRHQGKYTPFEQVEY